MSVDTSYEPFSREPEYVDLNRGFVDGIELTGVRTAVDIACGTGTLTELLWHALRGRDPSFHGLDLSRESLDLAQEHFAADPELSGPLARGQIRFSEGTAYELPVQDGWADLAVIGNAIHVFDEPQRLLAEVRRVLRPGGTFAFNSSFYAGTFAPGTERFYTEWLKHALAHIRAEDARRRRAGEPGITRRKGTAGPAFSRPWRSLEDWSALLDRCGFAVVASNERAVMMGRRAFETVGAYAGLASVLLSGYPVALACEALEGAVQPALAEIGMAEVPRRWLEVVARAREGTA